MVHAVSATFKRFEHMSPPAAGMALVLHALMAVLLWWSAPIHAPKETPPDVITVTMEAPPPPPEKKLAPEPPKPAPQPPPAPKAQPTPQQLPGLAPRGAIGPKNMYPKLAPGRPTDASPPQAEQTPAEKPEPPQPPPQQAMARPAEPPSPPPPPPPAPTLEQELPPVQAPPAPLTSRDIPRIAPPVPEHKPEPPRPPQRQQAQPQPAPQQLQSSPLSRLQRHAPSRQNEQPHATFVNPADTYAMNTIVESYQYRIVDQVARYHTDLAGAAPGDNVVVRFTIARNGRLLGIAVVRSSGKPAIDRGLIVAFQQVAPFPPLPAEISGDSATFTLTFGPRFQRR